MRARIIILRIFRAITITLVALLLLAFALIQFQQHLFRHRAERLLADFHQLDKDHATWPEAQQMMDRWYNWGYATGPCTPDHCIFTINVSDTVSMHLSALPERALNLLFSRPMEKLLTWLQWRGGIMSVRLVVLKGSLASKEINAWVRTPADEGAYPIGVNMRTFSNLAPEKSNFTYEVQMGQHPNYLVSRPGGCNICMTAWLDVALHISNTELNRLTDFKLDCFTQRLPCEYPGDFLPSIAPYHLYEEHEWEPQPPAICSVSAATRARDAKAIVVVDARSQSFMDGDDGRVEQDLMQPVIALKGVASWTAASNVDIHKLGWYGYEAAKGTPDRTRPGTRYILFLDDSPSEKDTISAGYCDVIPDTPSARAEVMQGIAEDGGPDLSPLSEWN